MNDPATDTFEVVRSDAPLGAEIRGVNLAGGIDDTTFEAIQAAWREHLVLIFRGQKISDHDLVAFAKALADANVELWTSTLDARGPAAEQLDLFEEGQHFLPISELWQPVGEDCAV